MTLANEQTTEKLIKASAAELHVHPIPVRAPSMVPSWYRYRRTIDADTQQKQVGIIYAFFLKMVLAPYRYRVPTIFLNGQKLKHFRQNVPKVGQSLFCP